jgi:hypothetical protein
LRPLHCFLPNLFEVVGATSGQPAKSLQGGPKWFSRGPKWFHGGETRRANFAWPGMLHHLAANDVGVILTPLVGIIKNMTQK